MYSDVCDDMQSSKYSIKYCQNRTRPSSLSLSLSLSFSQTFLYSTLERLSLTDSIGFDVNWTSLQENKTSISESSSLHIPHFWASISLALIFVPVDLSVDLVIYWQFDDDIMTLFVICTHSVDRRYGEKVHTE